MTPRRRIAIEMRVLAGTVVAIAGVILVAGCAGSWHTATGPAPSSGASPAPTRVQPIALARSSSDLFSIFPAKPGTKNCRIPSGGPAGVKPLRGVCTTSIRYPRTHEPELIVSFTEMWAPRGCKEGMACVAQLAFQHTWTVRETKPVVTAGARWRVWPSEQSGATAPQYYR